jgi:hypothetical protein
MRKKARPYRANRNPAKSRTANVVLAWESTRGEMRVCSPKSRPLKTALPNVAEAPQQNAAAAIKM